MKKMVLNGAYVGIGVLAFGLFLGGAGGGYTRLLEPELAFMLFVAGMFLGVVASVAGFVDLAKHGISMKAIVLVLGLIPAGTLIFLLAQGRSYPLLNDVTTDTVYPPEFEHAKTLEANASRNMEFPLEFKPEVESFYTDLAPQSKMMLVDDAYFEALEVVKGITNWEITSHRIDGKKSFIEGTVTSRVFGFVDDFVIRIEEANGGGCVVDMRSKSRSGQGDFGTNAEHIRLFMGLFE